MDAVILSRTIHVDHKDFGKPISTKPLGNMHILMECTGNFLSLCTIQILLKHKKKVESYIKKKIMACKIVQKTIKFGVRLESPKSSLWWSQKGLWFSMYLALLRNGSFGCKSRIYSGYAWEHLSDY